MKNIILAARRDGLTERLNAIFHGLLLSELLDTSFQFLWPSNPWLDATFHSVPASPLDVFSEEFCKQHHVELEEIENSVGFDVFNSSAIKKYTFGGEVDNDYILSPLRLELSKIGISRELLKLVQTKFISSFRSEFRANFNAIDSVLADNKNFMSIHLRSGDVVYGEHKKHGAYARSKSLTYSAALAACRKFEARFESFCFFGATKSELKLITSQVQNAFNSSLFNLRIDDSTQEMICEAYIMSKASHLIAAKDTGVSYFAGLIGDVEVKSIEEALDENEEINFANDFINSNTFTKLSNEQKAFIFLNNFILARNTAKHDELQSYLLRAFEFDGQDLYCLALIFNSIKFNQKISLQSHLIQLGGTGDVISDWPLLREKIENIKVKSFLMAVIRVSKGAKIYKELPQSIRFYLENIR